MRFDPPRRARCWWTVFGLIVIVLARGVAAQGARTQSEDRSSGPLPAETGRYLAAAGNCISCHTREGGAPFAGGVAFVTRFGTLYSTNITQDPEFGIGRWTQADFARALREGMRPGGEHLYPAFPYTSFTKITDADIAALFAYMKTVEPAKVPPVPNNLSFPYNQRWALGLWNKLYFDAGRFVADGRESQQWNRGAYLVEGLGHCGACHTPRKLLGAEDPAQAYTGAVYQDTVDGKLLDWSSSNLTSAPAGLGGWSIQEIADFLQYGHSARAGVFGPMNEVILNSTRWLTQQDAHAIAVYLKSLPAKTQDLRPPLSTDQMSATELLYSVNCGTCHLPTGLGSETTGPPLVGSAVVQAPSPASLINVTLYGAQVPHTSPSDRWQARKWQRMEPFADKISDDEVAAILSYVRGAWGNQAGAVSAAEVAKQR